MTPMNSGTEATVFSADDPELGRVVVKVYRRDLHPDPDLVARLKQGNVRHLVRLHDARNIGGRWVEVLEWVAAGSLDTLAAGMSESTRLAVLEEMTAALQSFHALGLVHRDVKPANVLVRGTSPLELVLSDFGLAAFVSDSLDLRAQDRTINYSSPETNAGVPGLPSADWWSLGMMLAEFGLGHHPFDGLTPVEIANHLAARDVDLNGITHPRWRQLLSGLLTRDAAHRWGAVEIRSWLGGADPLVWRPSYAHPPYTFDGERFGTSRELAAGLGEKWSIASGVVSGNLAWSQLAGWLINESPGDSGLAARLDQVAQTTNPDARLLRLLRTLAPDLVPVYRSYTIDEPGLAGLAAAAAASRPAELGAVSSLYANCGLGYRDAAGQAIDERWHAAGDELKRLTGSHTTLDTPAQDQARARLLAAACSDEQHRALVAEATRVARRDMMAIDWFAEVARQASSSAAAAVATLVLAPAAEAAVRDRREEERSDREDRRRRAHESTTERYPRTRLWLGWTTVAMGFVAAASLAGELVRIPTGSLSIGSSSSVAKSRLIDELLSTDAMRDADGWVPGLIGYARFVFTPVWTVALFVVGLALWIRARGVGSSNGPVRTEAERRAMQAAVVVGHVWFPVLLVPAAVISYRYHRSDGRHTASPAQRRRRRALFVAATGFALHGVAALAHVLPSLRDVMFDFPSWYAEFLSKVPRQFFWTVEKAADMGWTMVVISIVLAAATYGLGVRAYRTVDTNEIRCGWVLTIVGIVALIPGLLLAGFFPVVGAGIVIASLVGLALGLYIIGMMLAGGD